MNLKKAFQYQKAIKNIMDELVSGNLGSSAALQMHHCSTIWSRICSGCGSSRMQAAWMDRNNCIC